MPGERTPDQSKASSGSGSTDNDISLREHMQRQVDAASATARQEHARVQEYFDQRLKDMRDLLDQRFEAQQHAVDELKTTTTQRFESVNEFRLQLNDQATRFMLRNESIQRHDATVARIEGLERRLTESLSTVNSRLDLNQGKGTGLDKAWGYIIGAVGLVGAAVAILLSIN